ncbi:polynucleotide adenylyltransferase PcnB [Pseudaquabacterium rugosum]|uniref:Poly(A) polymerase I n=1 Tax=Pseudaquabacterium rugosum TaxID=2984194 RepID=A0ABU9B7A9_9BURK
MIKNLIKRLLGQGGAPRATAVAAAAFAADAPVSRARIPLGRRVEIPASEHGIDARLVDDRAVKVVRTLQEAGYEAYVVGGAVRDLLVGRRPKDFDVATNATPEQVKGLFRRAFIIGRRFRIVHVVHGRGREHEVIEVSTFRAYLDNSEALPIAGNEKTHKAALADSAHAVDASGRVLRDNVWGPQIEDAARRDFTVNAMYYDPQTQVVVDYHGGLTDLRAGLLRLIGDPLTRYREDPVRVIRAMRFAAKLGFGFEPATAAPFAEVAPLLANVPTSRLFDEMIKLLQTGHALDSIETLRTHGLLRGVFPILDAVYDEARTSPEQQDFIRLALADTDRRVGEGKPVAPSFLLAALLWHEVLAGWRERTRAGEHLVPALQAAIDAVFDARVGDISGRGKLGADMREIWMMQPRFERRQSGPAYTLVEQARFRAGFDFLRLRADVGEAPAELAEWWEDFSLGSPDDREAMLQAAREAQRAGQRRAPGRAAQPTRVAADGGVPGPADALDAADAPDLAEGPDDAAEDAADEGADFDAPAESGNPARKRRRRRRKPRAGGAAGEGGGESGGEGVVASGPAADA